MRPRCSVSPTGFDFLNRSKIDRFAELGISTYDIQTPSIQKKVLNLSGGNQQKCLVAMWMGIDPQVIIFDEPTRGVDVGARAEIYRKLREFASSGVGIIIISSDLPELIGMCDRVLVMHKGPDGWRSSAVRIFRRNHPHAMPPASMRSAQSRQLLTLDREDTRAHMSQK